jgi:hypothetical protein
MTHINKIISCLQRLGIKGADCTVLKESHYFCIIRVGESSFYPVEKLASLQQPRNVNIFLLESLHCTESTEGHSPLPRRAGGLSEPSCCPASNCADRA